LAEQLEFTVASTPEDAREKLVAKDIFTGYRPTPELLWKGENAFVVRPGGKYNNWELAFQLEPLSDQRLKVSYQTQHTSKPRFYMNLGQQIFVALFVCLVLVPDLSIFALILLVIPGGLAWLELYFPPTFANRIATDIRTALEA
jgi:hypothetical protein